MQTWLKDNAVSIAMFGVIVFMLMKQNKPSDSTPNLRSDPAVVAAAKEAMSAYVKGVIASYEATAQEIDAGRLLTVSEAADFNVSKESPYLDDFKKSMASIMKPRLGSERLPAGSSQVFKDVSAGFSKSVR